MPARAQTIHQITSAHAGHHQVRDYKIDRRASLVAHRDQSLTVHRFKHRMAQLLERGDAPRAGPAVRLPQ